MFENINLKFQMPQSAKKLTKNGSHLAFLKKTWCYRIYNIPIGFSDLENVGVYTKFVFLSWPKTEIGAIQFVEDIACSWFWRWSIWILLETVNYKSSFML